MKWLLLLLWISSSALAASVEGTWEGTQDGQLFRLVLDADGAFELSADAYVQNENGVYDNFLYSAVIFGGEDSDFSVPGTSGWYLLVSDPRKRLVGENYQLKFVR